MLFECVECDQLGNACPEVDQSHCSFGLRFHTKDLWSQTCRKVEELGVFTPHGKSIEDLPDRNKLVFNHMDVQLFKLLALVQKNGHATIQGQVQKVVCISPDRR